MDLVEEPVELGVELREALFELFCPYGGIGRHVSSFLAAGVGPAGALAWRVLDVGWDWGRVMAPVARVDYTTGKAFGARGAAGGVLPHKGSCLRLTARLQRTGLPCFVDIVLDRLGGPCHDG